LFCLSILQAPSSPSKNTPSLACSLVDLEQASLAASIHCSRQLLLAALLSLWLWGEEHEEEIGRDLVWVYGQ